MKEALVSVLMPVYNSGSYIRDSLASILNQTYKNLEVIIVDDACTDDSLDIVHSFCDSRIRLIKNPENLGLATSLNKAIRFARGEYLARMDADDIAFPNRIEKQVSFLEQHREIDLLGTGMQYFGQSSYLNLFPETHDGCKSFLLLNVCFGHPTVLFRRQVFADDSNYYKDELKQYSEEFNLWCRLVDKFKFHNLPEVLLYYRTFPSAVKGEGERLRKMNSINIVRDYLTGKLGPCTNEDFAIHIKATQIEVVNNCEELHLIDKWFLKILGLNQSHHAFDATVLEQQLAERFFEICYRQSHIGLGAVQVFSRSSWSDIYRPSHMLFAKFLIRVILKMN